MRAASSDTGFFQQQPILKNQAEDDPSLERILQCLFYPHVPCDIVASNFLKFFFPRTFSANWSRSSQLLGTGFSPKTSSMP